MRLWAIVAAAGKGERLGGTPKQYREVRGHPVLWHTLHRLAPAPGLSGMVVGLASGDPRFDTLVGLPAGVRCYVGGASRMETVWRGISALSDARPGDWVLVHDAARPCLARSDLAALAAVAGAGERAGALLVAPVSDTLKRGSEGHVVETVDRKGLYRALTPQLFPMDVLDRALRVARDRGWAATDESAAVEQLGLQPRLVMGRPDNLKITYETDLTLAEAVLARLEAEGE